MNLKIINPMLLGRPLQERVKDLWTFLRFIVRLLTGSINSINFLTVAIVALSEDLRHSFISS
jgi:hypothetical protein